jgi:hypothetical protein
MTIALCNATLSSDLNKYVCHFSTVLSFKQVRI